jgi:hypothetical protein
MLPLPLLIIDVCLLGLVQVDFYRAELRNIIVFVVFPEGVGQERGLFAIWSIFIFVRSCRDIGHSHLKSLHGLVIFEGDHVEGAVEYFLMLCSQVQELILCMNILRVETLMKERTMFGHLLKTNELPAGHTDIMPWAIGVVHDPIVVK